MSRIGRAALAIAGGLALLVLPARAAHAQLTIRVREVPASTPTGATMHVAGSFNAWNPGDPRFALARTDSGYAITLPADVRGPVEFKLTLGAWERVETTAAGDDVPNRRFTIPDPGRAMLDVTVAAWRAGAPKPKPSTARRSVRVIADSFAMPQLGRARRVWLYLPPDYATSRKRYPVLYMHDGQNVFDDSTSFAGEWGVDETLDSLHARGDRGAIVVAVDNGGSHRMDEYNPWRAAQARLGGGEGKEYVDFLVRTLKPWIDARYRTLRDPAHTGVMGSSMGGLISLYAALEHPKVFGRAGVFSCACWVADTAVLNYARRTPPRRSSRLWFESGAFETPEGQPARDQRTLVDTLLAAGWPRSALHESASPDGKHAEWFWRREFAAAYLWLFRR